MRFKTMELLSRYVFQCLEKAHIIISLTSDFLNFIFLVYLNFSDRKKESFIWSRP